MAIALRASAASVLWPASMAVSEAPTPRLDPWGNMREDANKSGRLDLACGVPRRARVRPIAGGQGRLDRPVRGLRRSLRPGGGGCLPLGQEQILSEDHGPPGPRLKWQEPPGQGRVKAFMSLQDVRPVWDLGRALAEPSAKADVVTPRASL